MIRFHFLDNFPIYLKINIFSDKKLWHEVCDYKRREAVVKPQESDMNGIAAYRQILRPRPERCRVLVVDGNEQYASRLCCQLSSTGHTVTRARNAEEAAIFGKVDWDLIITDWTVSKLQGGALLQSLRPAERPVIVWSDHPDASPQQAVPGIKAFYRRSQQNNLEKDVRSMLTPIDTSEDQIATKQSFLIIEDSSTVRRFVKKVVQDRYPNADVHEAEDGASALSVMKNNRVSLIFTDLQMPGMDGESFVSLLSQNALLKKKPVIVFSGAITEEVKSKMIKRDCIRLVAKPASPDTIDEAIKSLLAEQC